MKILSSRICVVFILMAVLVFSTAFSNLEKTGPNLYGNEARTLLYKSPDILNPVNTVKDITGGIIFREVVYTGIPVFTVKISDESQFEIILVMVITMLEKQLGGKIKFLSKRYTKLADGTEAQDILLSWNKPRVAISKTIILRIIKGN